MKKSVILMIMMSFFVSIASAEYIYMKSGEEIQGKIVSETRDSITISISGKRKKLMLKDIDEISSKRKENRLPPKAKSDDTNVDAKVQFSSKAKQDMPGSQVYVADNESGIIVYNVKETKKTKASKKTAAADTKKKKDDAEIDAAKQKTDTTKAAAGEFDAALYLLSGGESGSDSVRQNTAEKLENDPNVAPVVYVQGEKQEDIDDAYDPVKYLLGEYGDDYSTDKEDNVKRKKPAREKKAKKEKMQKIILSEDIKKDTVKGEKPENETFLAVSFDLKGVHIESGDIIESGINKSADKTQNSDYGMTISAEQYAYFSRFAAAGLGISYEFNRCLEDDPGRFSFLPIYAAFKMRVFTKEDYYFYAVAQLGYNFIIANTSYLGKLKAEGGAYYAGGAGASYNQHVFQILYSVNNACFSYNNSVVNEKVDKDLNYSKVGFYAGYMF